MKKGVGYLFTFSIQVVSMRQLGVLAKATENEKSLPAGATAGYWWRYLHSHCVVRVLEDKEETAKSTAGPPHRPN